MAVVRSRVLERLNPAEELADVAEKNAARLPLVPTDAVDLDLGLETASTAGSPTGPHVGDAPETILQPAVGVSDHRCVESAPAMAPNRSPLNLPTSSERRSPCSPIPTACPMSFGMPRLDGEQVCRPGGDDREASRPIRRVRRRSAEPSRLRPRQTRAPPPRRAARRRWAGAFRLFGTSNQSGSLTPSASSRRRSSSSPPPSVLPEWATTATFIRAPAPSLRGKLPIERRLETHRNPSIY